MKVRLKKEIVTLGLPQIDPSDRVGTYVSPKEWNALMSDPEVTIIDTRNDYEVSIGSFKGAQNPKTASFRQFPTTFATTSIPANTKRLHYSALAAFAVKKRHHL
jgi:UPF0176 protein